MSLGISVKRWWCRECQAVLKHFQVSFTGKCQGCLAPVREVDWEMLAIYFNHRAKFDAEIKAAQIASLKYNELYAKFMALKQDLDQL